MSVLEYVGREFVNFNDRSFRWVDVKNFRVVGGASEDDALDSLIGDVRYRDNYAQANSHEHPSDNRHGPYWLDRVTRAAFDRVDEEAALRTIRDFAIDYGGLRADVIASLERDVYAPIRALPVRYLLKDLGENAIHDWGSVLTTFHELVVVGSAEAQLALIVAAVD